MTNRRRDHSMRSALFDLREYLSDLISPIQATEAFGMLFAQHPQLVATEIRTWITTSIQRGDNAGLNVLDLLLHALEKVHILGDFGIVEPVEFRAYTVTLARLMLSGCSEEEQARFFNGARRLGYSEAEILEDLGEDNGETAGKKAAVNSMGMAGEGRQGIEGQAKKAPEAIVGAPGSSGAATEKAESWESPIVTTPKSSGKEKDLAPWPTSLGPVEAVKPQVRPGMGVEIATEKTVDPDARQKAALELKRARLMLKRVCRNAEKPESENHQSQEARQELRVQLWISTILAANNPAELSRNLKGLWQRGWRMELGELFQLLAGRVMNWSLGSPTRYLPGAKLRQWERPAAALKKLVLLSKSDGENQERYHALIEEAIRHLNTGALQRAATLFDLSLELANLLGVDNNYVKVLRYKSHANVNLDTLRKLAKKQEQQPVFKRVLRFFSAFSVSALLADLKTAEKRDQRRLMMALLEVYGQEMRQEVLRRLKVLEPDNNEDPKGYFRRNLLYLMRRVPPRDGYTRKEIELVGRLAQHTHSRVLAKEAIVSLVEMKSEATAETLIQCAQYFETMLCSSQLPPGEAGRIKQHLDRTIRKGLAVLGHRNAIRTVEQHCLKQQPELGETLPRLAGLGAQDLSAHPDIVKRLTKSLEAKLPRKLFGLARSKSVPDAMPYLLALSRTRAPEVVRLMESISERFSSIDLGKEAARALQKLREPQVAKKLSPPRSGKLEPVQLPGLLESLALAEATGELVILNRKNQPRATIKLHRGLFQDCRQQRLKGLDAFFDLFERPRSLVYRFQPGEDGAEEGENSGTKALKSCWKLLSEAMRRHDEFCRDRTLVPDDAILSATGTRPTPPPGEPSRQLSSAVWRSATTGTIPAKIEVGLPVDSYRVRRLLAHWVEEDALTLG